MVSLFDMCLQQPTWAHLSTGIPTLDQMLDLQSDGLFDFQTVPANPGMPAMICSLMVSHLRESENLTVAVIESLNPFQWDLLRQHPQYDPQWEKRGQIKVYSLMSVVEFFWFFTFGPARSLGASSILLFILNFHEIVELYRLHIAAAYEEALLKHQIDKNRELLANLDRIQAEGIELVSLPQLPALSDLLRQSPYVKAQNHIDELFKEMSEFTYQHSAIIVLVGCLEAKFKPIPKLRAPSPSPTSSFNGSQTQVSLSQNVVRESNRLVLDPVTFGKQSSGNRSSADLSLNESKITARLIFYNDWYHKSPLFLSKQRPPLESEQFKVLAIKVTSFNGVSNINDPVYFNLSTHHCDEDGKGDPESWLIDLQAQDEGNLSAFIQDSINSTQQVPRAVSTQIARLLAISSSPPINTTQTKVISTILSTQENADCILNKDVLERREEGEEFQENELYIEGSDVELTGTLLEDMESDT